MTKPRLMLGNEAIARGLFESDCRIATSYPGTPASEILSSLVMLQQEAGESVHSQWAINEKVAFEIAYAGCLSGLRSAVSMKQVGLNVASDPLMSAAYMGTRAGFVVISADDPGPHSSQTEQDSRLMAMMAKIPVLDPDSPEQAKQMVAMAYELSETFETPVMIRPTTRVCHARQDILPGVVRRVEQRANFEKDPARWAATPKFRFRLHTALEKKLAAMADYGKTRPIRLNPDFDARRAIVVSGVAAAHAREIIKALNLWDSFPLYQVLQPHPLHQAFISHVMETYDEILVLEETTGVIEMQIADRRRTRGKFTGSAPRVGELLPETIQGLIEAFAGIPMQKVEAPAPPGRRPTLCAGCPHRASFFAIKKAAPTGIFTSDIGCYTLGLNLGAVDTVLCMGAAISQATGFFHAFKKERKRPDIVATIGDSTFFHAGIPALIDAVSQKVGVTVVILDNRTTAMTGNQPTPATGVGAMGEPLAPVDIESVVRGCGVGFCRQSDPYQLEVFIPLIKEAIGYSREKGPSVVIARRPCLIDRRLKDQKNPEITVVVTEACDGCGYCIEHFECPALGLDETSERVRIDPVLCARCGVCIQVCPKKAFQEKP